MEVTAGVLQDEDGKLFVGVHAGEGENDPNATVLIMPVDVARELAFGVMEACDQIEPPAWREEQ